MAYKTYTRQDLANLTGRPLASFPQTFVEASAIPQAMLLFKMGTCLASPDDLTDEQKQLVDFAIVFMADAIHLTAPYQRVKYTPFNSESIGSYSYSRAAAAVSIGKVTGVDWFDLAVQQLSVCDVMDGIPMSSGIDVFGAGEGFPQTGPGVKRYFTEAEKAASRKFGYDISGASPNLGIPIVIAPSPSEGNTSGGAWVEDPNAPGVYIWEE